MPENFSLAYAVMFCAGVFFPGRRAWLAPLAVLLITDLALNLHYHGKGYSVFNAGMLLYLAGNYLGYAGLIGLGRCFKPSSRLLSLLGGGLVGALLFYLITNTYAWLFNPFRNPEYTRDIAGWLRALTLGTSGFPETWTFFRNTLLSSGLFTVLFSFTLQHSAAPEPLQDSDDEAAEPSSAPRNPEPEEA